MIGEFLRKLESGKTEQKYTFDDLVSILDFAKFNIYQVYRSNIFLGLTNMMERNHNESESDYITRVCKETIKWTKFMDDDYNAWVGKMREQFGQG